LTTAASLFLVAGIGIAVRLGQIILAMCISGFALVLLRAVAILKTNDRG
jgi:uncharacterized membrane protein YhiD involved in acid resistance